MKLSEKCEQFLKHNEVNTCDIIDNDSEGYFSWSGCDCCKNSLGQTVYDCHGYSPKNKEIYELGQICGDCIGYFYNGTES